MQSLKTLINGEWIKTDETIEVINPSNNQVLALIPNISGKQAFDYIYESAHKAYLIYKDTTVDYRIDLLNKFKDKLKEHREKLAEILVREIAKSHKDSLSEIDRSVEYIEQTINEYQEMVSNPLTYDEKKLGIKGKKAVYYRIPVGVVCCISPFNYPLNLLISKLAPALVAGNSVVFKPATQGSIVALEVARFLHDVGYPAGVVNCVTTDVRKNSDYLITNKHIKALSFTGGPKVGNMIASKTSKINLVLELGGKDAALVMEDADLEKATDEIVKGAFSYSGQRCTAIKRVFVDKKIHHEFALMMAEKVKKLTVGLPLDNPDIGPVISRKSMDYNIELLQDAFNQNASFLTTLRTDFDHNILSPVLLDNVTQYMRVAWEEPFGPILPILEYPHLDYAINLINQSEYGLQASIFTKNVKKAKEIAMKLEVGTVNINKSSSRGPDILPFFGVKDSGFGVQGIRDALLSMTNLHGIITNK
ncbi:aldehyde dehydrogenase family protein [Ureaplasma canigenitalium]|uniref:aldehyde dehydrogenase family protein n=1 Tax=Ureaplasma canigenitalium TaxID=42092 RepID=UPI0004E11DDC|nr:aldehyde dehydrogenase family protein [Ureaplasma canigenitalium]